MTTRFAALAAGAALLAASALSASPAAAAAKVGTLTCRSAGTINEVFSSSETVLCTYKPFGSFQVAETYVGTLDTFGIDLGITGRTVMVWSVLAASFQSGEPASLRGTYYGTSVDAAFAAGVGAKTLVGGPDRGFTLQPTSVQIQEGINATVGIARLTLEDAEPAAGVVVYKP